MVEKITEVCCLIIRNKNELLITREENSPTYFLPAEKVKEHEAPDFVANKVVKEKIGGAVTSIKQYKGYRITDDLFAEPIPVTQTYVVEILGSPKPNPSLELIWLGQKNFKEKQGEIAPLLYDIIGDLIDNHLLKWSWLNL